MEVDRRKMENLQAIFSAFIVIVIGAVLLISTANTTTSVTQNYVVNNETVAFANGTTVSLAHTQLISIGSIYNATNGSQTLASTNYTVDLPHGTIAVVSNGRTGNFNVTTYTYNQVSDSTSNGLVNFNTLFFAFSVFFTFLAAINPTFREWIQENVFKR